MPIKSSADSITDDILWSDCPEELYLRRMLQEQYHEEGTIVDSILGQSTVAGIFSGDVDKSPQADDRCDGRSWLNFSPIAGSVATAPITPDEEEMSPPLEKKKKKKKKGKKDNAKKQKVKSSEAEPPDEEDKLKHDINLKKSVPVDINPRFIDFDEESSTGSLHVIRIPDIVDMDDAYDEEATEIDVTRGGLSTLSGDTFLRNIGLQTVQPDAYDDEATEIDATRGGLSTLSGDSFLRNIGLQTQQPTYKRTWVDVDDISYAKAFEDSTGATSKSSKHDSRSESRHDQAHAKPVPTTTRAPGSDSKTGCCCSRIIQMMTEDDRIFRRTVIVAVVLIVLFVSLSVFALIRSGDFFLSDTTAPASSPPVATHANQETDIPSFATTSLPSVSPTQSENSSVHGNEVFPTTAPSISDPFRFVSTLINERSPDSLKHFRNPESPQNQAFLWLISDLPNTMETSDERVLQRWTLAVLFYSLGGNGWTRDDGWLTEPDVCDWFTSSTDEVCNEFGLLRRLDLAQNNLQGQLPMELALLSSSLIEINLEGNGIAGSILANLDEMGSLGRFERSFSLATRYA